LPKTKILYTFFCFFIFLSIIFVSLILPKNTINLGNSGNSGKKDFIFKGNFFAVKVYDIGDILCHQYSYRSFFINGNQMPICSRCFGVFLGLFIGAIISFKNKSLKPLHFILLLPIAIDGTGQALGFWISFNLLRLVTGILTGMLASLAMCMVIDNLYVFQCVLVKPLCYKIHKILERLKK